MKSAELKKLCQDAEQGDVDAQAVLGVKYDQGLDVPQNHDEAVRWYRLAAEQGHRACQALLGMMYYKGKGVPQDYEEAVRWVRMAADGGDVESILVRLQSDPPFIPVER